MLVIGEQKFYYCFNKGCIHIPPYICDICLNFGREIIGISEQLQVILTNFNFSVILEWASKNIVIGLVCKYLAIRCLPCHNLFKKNLRKCDVKPGTSHNLIWQLCKISRLVIYLSYTYTHIQLYKYNWVSLK